MPAEVAAGFAHCSVEGTLGFDALESMERILGDALRLSMKQPGFQHDFRCYSRQFLLTEGKRRLPWNMENKAITKHARPSVDRR